MIYTSKLLLADNVKTKFNYQWIDLSQISNYDLVYESYNSLARYKARVDSDKLDSGLVNLPKILVTNRTVITNLHNEILIIKRSKDDSYEPGKWELPGGKLDAYESLTTHLEREIFEETGLLVQIINPTHGSTSYVISDGKYKGFTHITLLSLATSKLDRVKLSMEHEDYKWVSLEEVRDIDISITSRKVLYDYLDKVDE